jgi:hypothetical protein
LPQEGFDEGRPILPDRERLVFHGNIHIGQIEVERVFGSGESDIDR